MNIKAPRRLPTLADMITDLNASPREVGRALGVAESSVYRWLSIGKAPRPAMLALYWMTRWGRSDIDADMWNRANTYQGLASALERELSSLLQDIEHLGVIGDYGSANDPVNRIKDRYGLDHATTFKPVEGTEHAATRQVRAGPRSARSRR